MTDPRIEAAVDAAWSHTTQFASGETFDQYNKRKPYEGGEFRKSIVSALAEADAAAWRLMSEAPRDGVEIIALGKQRADAASPIEPYLGVVWWEHGLWQDGTIACRPALTHWRHLPRTAEGRGDGMSRATPTQYGFKWGACEVSRLYDYGGHVTMELKTDTARLSIRVTPSGQFRVEQTAGRGSAVKMDGPAPDTITIPQVRNDRPIERKGGVDG